MNVAERVDATLDEKDVRELVNDGGDDVGASSDGGTSATDSFSSAGEAGVGVGASVTDETRREWIGKIPEVVEPPAL